MNDLTQLSYKILFLAMLAVLVTLSVPAPAQDPGNVGGPGAPTILEGRGAAAPLPAPSEPATTEPAVDDTPADEVRSNTTTLEPDELKADPEAKAARVEPNADAMTPSSPDKSAEMSESADGSAKKAWWHFW